MADREAWDDEVKADKWLKEHGVEIKQYKTLVFSSGNGGRKWVPVSGLSPSEQVALCADELGIAPPWEEEWSEPIEDMTIIRCEEVAAKLGKQISIVWAEGRCYGIFKHIGERQWYSPLSQGLLDTLLGYQDALYQAAYRAKRLRGELDNAYKARVRLSPKEPPC